MYDKIRKPKLLKDIPISLIRPLPVIYYANYYANQGIPQSIQKYYQTSIHFLSEALLFLSGFLQNRDYQKIADLTSQLASNPSAADLDHVIAISTNLSTLCSSSREDLREKNQEIKNRLSALYLSTVNTLKVIVVDNSMGQENLTKVLNILKNFCQYKVDAVQPNAPEIISKLIDADLVLFYSIASPEIHNQVRSLETFHKPGLALAKIEGNGSPDKEIIRHGAQLMKMGFCVLFKMFTPLRLFTTIDKTFIAFNMQ